MSYIVSAREWNITTARLLNSIAANAVDALRPKKKGGGEGTSGGEEREGVKEIAHKTICLTVRRGGVVV